MKTKYEMAFAIVNCLIAVAALGGPLRWEGNGHYYELVRTEPLSWESAKSQAESRVYMGTKGHLATLTSAEENAWVAQNFDTEPRAWLGGYQDHSAPDYAEPNGGWRWITGEEWAYANWHLGEPSNGWPPGEDHLELWGGDPERTWNDYDGWEGNPAAYLVEFDTGPESHNCLQPPAGLVAWWPGDGHAYDIVGTNHGTPKNGATAAAAGWVAQAFAFDGVDDFIEARDTGLPAGAAPRTLEFWMKPAYNARIPVLYGGYDAFDAFYILVEDDHAKIGRYWGGDVGGSAVVTDGRWHHAALTYDGGTNVCLFIDGAIDATANWSYNTTLRGTIEFGISLDPRDRYNGLLDEVAIYNRALSPVEIAAIYAAGSAGKCKEESIVLTIRVSQVEVCWNSRPNSTYQVQYCSELTTNIWTPLFECIRAIGPSTCIYDAVPLGQPRRYYRVVSTNCVPQP